MWINGEHFTESDENTPEFERAWNRAYGSNYSSGSADDAPLRMTPWGLLRHDSPNWDER